jgi:hypothetical protein
MEILRIAIVMGFIVFLAYLATPNPPEDMGGGWT